MLYSFYLTKKMPDVTTITWIALFDAAMLLFTQYKTIVHWITAISSHCLAALLAKRSAFNSPMRMWQNAYFRNFKRTFEESLPCYCYALRPTIHNIRSQVWQPASAEKWAYMSELQAHHCMTPEQRIWLLCSVSVIPAPWASEGFFQRRH